MSGVLLISIFGKTGDLVAFRGRSLISRIISLFSFWTHVGMIKVPGVVIAAEDDGVRELKLEDYAKTHVYEIVPVDRPYSFCVEAVESMVRKKGRKYDQSLLIGNLLYRLLGRPSFLIRWTDHPDRDICVEAVASSYREAGENFDQDINAMSPDDLAKHFGWVRK